MARLKESLPAAIINYKLKMAPIISIIVIILLSCPSFDFRFDLYSTLFS